MIGRRVFFTGASLPRYEKISNKRKKLRDLFTSQNNKLKMIGFYKVLLTAPVCIVIGITGKILLNHSILNLISALGMDLIFTSSEFRYSTCKIRSPSYFYICNTNEFLEH